MSEPEGGGDMSMQRGELMSLAAHLENVAEPGDDLMIQWYF